MNKWRKGSMTVEMALLTPLVLLAWMGAVSACLFVHNRAWLTGAAYESAITGSWDAIRAQGDAECRTREKLCLLLGDSLYGARDIHKEAEEKNGRIFVTVTGRHGAFGGLHWSFCVTGSRKLCRPVLYIREARRARIKTGGG